MNVCMCARARERDRGASLGNATRAFTDEYIQCTHFTYLKYIKSGIQENSKIGENPLLFFLRIYFALKNIFYYQVVHNEDLCNMINES